MTDKVLVIPATFKVGTEFPPYLPLPHGQVKPTAECSQSEVASAVEELKGVARMSRERLEQAYAEHVRDVETLAQISAYLARFEQSHHRAAEKASAAGYGDALTLPEF